LAALGDHDEAIRAGERAVELMPLTADWFRGFYRSEDLARIQATLGENDAALERLEYLMSIDGDLGRDYLAADPTWGALRDHPRFQALVGAAQ